MKDKVDLPSKQRKEQGTTSALKVHLKNALPAIESFLPHCLAAKKKKLDPNVSRSLKKYASILDCARLLILKSTLVNRFTWEYVGMEPGMKAVRFTWVFKAKTLDFDCKKIIKRARCYMRGDQQMLYVDYEP